MIKSLKQSGKSLLAASIVLGMGLASATQEGDFTFTNNQISLTSTGSSQTPTIGGTGLISQVTQVPKTSDLGIPGFSFGFARNGTLTDGTYTFRVGVVIDDDNSGRRIEAVIQTVNIESSNGGTTLTGNTPSGQNLQLIGRDDSGSLTLLVSVANPSAGGPISINGANASFNSTNLISRIKSSVPSSKLS